MTHTLHRQATSGDAKKEFLLIAMPAKGVNHTGSKPKLVKILDICESAGAVNLGDTQQSNIYDLGSSGELFKRMLDGAIAGALFDSRENVEQALRKIKAEDTGMSVVVTGDIEEIKDICDDMGLSPHTVAKSLGIMGRTEPLPTGGRLQLMTMCGHGMVTERMLKAAQTEIEEETTTVDDAVLKMAKCCVCGCFNPTRAKGVLERLSKGRDKDIEE